MSILLSIRGLAALAWLSAFAYPYLYAFGLVPGGWLAVGVILSSLVVAMAASGMSLPGRNTR